jgi:hypothetical protein
MLLFCYDLHSVRLVFNIFSVVPLQWALRLYFRLMNCSDRQSVSFQSIYFLMSNGFEPLCNKRRWSGDQKSVLACISCQHGFCCEYSSLQSSILAFCSYISDSALQASLSAWSQSFWPLPDPLPSKQSFYDRTEISTVRIQFESSLVTNRQRASFLAATAPHSGDWLLA